MGRKLVLLGANHHAREVIWLVKSINDNCSPSQRWKLIGMIDDVTKDVRGKTIDGIPILGGFDYFEKHENDNLHVIAAVGEPESKKILVNKVRSFGLTFATLVHPSAVVAPTATISPGSVVFPLATISVNVFIGNHVTINMDCSLSHDCVVEEFATLSPGVRLAGYVGIGKSAFLGIGSIVKDRISIGARSILGAGAVAVKSISENVVAVGVPAKPVRKMEKVE